MKSIRLTELPDWQRRFLDGVRHSSKIIVETTNEQLVPLLAYARDTGEKNAKGDPIVEFNICALDGFFKNGQDFKKDLVAVMHKGLVTEGLATIAILVSECWVGKHEGDEEIILPVKDNPNKTEAVMFNVATTAGQVLCYSAITREPDKVGEIEEFPAGGINTGRFDYETPQH